MLILILLCSFFCKSNTTFMQFYKKLTFKHDFNEFERFRTARSIRVGFKTRRQTHHSLLSDPPYSNIFNRGWKQLYKNTINSTSVSHHNSPTSANKCSYVTKGGGFSKYSTVTIVLVLILI